MFFKRIDLLSEQPQISIFNMDYNKTLFGGVLFLIYISTLIIINH